MAPTKQRPGDGDDRRLPGDATGSAATAAEPDSPPRDPSAGAAGPARRRRRPAIELMERWGTLVGFAAMIAAFWAAEPTTFGTVENWKNILDQSAITIILGVGLTVVLAVGEFDLSFPYAIGLSSGTATIVMTHGGSTGVAVAVALLVGMGAGMLAGAVVATQRASSFIITLAVGYVWLGIADGVTGGKTIAEGLRDSFIGITDHNVSGITLAVFVAAGVAILAAVLLRATVFGRYLQSVGSNASAARLAGVSLSRTRIAAYGVLGLLVGVVAVIVTARQAQFTPNVGQEFFLPPYVAAFFGMSVLAARRFNILGTVVGALFIGTLQTGLIIVGASAWVSELVQGLVLLLTLVLARRTRS